MIQVAKPLVSLEFDPGIKHQVAEYSPALGILATMP